MSRCDLDLAEYDAIARRLPNRSWPTTGYYPPDCRGPAPSDIGRRHLLDVEVMHLHKLVTRLPRMAWHAQAIILSDL
jgi:hypothetical protein